jgi:hypothetical protein
MLDGGSLLVIIAGFAIDMLVTRRRVLDNPCLFL